MDENEILAAIKSVKPPPQKLSYRFPEYPCDRCRRMNCTVFRDCAAWRIWSGNRWREIGEYFGIVRKTYGK